MCGPQLNPPIAGMKIMQMRYLQWALLPQTPHTAVVNLAPCDFGLPRHFATGASCRVHPVGWLPSCDFKPSQLTAGNQRGEARPAQGPEF